MGLNHIKASNGNGEAVRASVTALRAEGSTTLKVDALTNWPPFFIATAGKLLATGELDPSTTIVFEGHITGSDIVIDAFAPGYEDEGNSVGDAVLVKPSTLWADTIAEVLDVSLDNDGTLNDEAIEQVLGTGQIADDIRIAPRISAVDTLATLTPDVDDYNYYRITAQAGALAVANHEGTPLDGEGLLIEIQDSGTSRAISWGTDYVADSVYGLTLPTATVAGKTHFITFIWNEALAKYVAVL